MASKHIFRLKKEIIIGILLFLLNYILKTYKIEKGHSVVWDEAHFGKFSRRYLKREFYFDVHPPLGKMMTALSGFLFKQDLDFKFESGNKYPENMDYVGMRRFHAFWGSFIPVFIFGILRELKYTSLWSFTFSLLYVFENGMTSISRLILLDSHLMFFTALTTYFLVKLYARKGTFKNLLGTGLSIGCVMSVKWIGCLTTLMVGLYIIYELWKTLTKRTFTSFCVKFCIRSVLLIMMPIAIYLFWFLIHFSICNVSTSDEAHMSSLFQATLKNGKLENVKKYIAFGSIITIKSSKRAGGNLHSHPHDYPDTNYNQITTYFHKDENNHWAFQKVINDGETADYLRDKDNVVIYHSATKSYLGIDSKDAYASEGKRVIGVKEKILSSCVWTIETVSDDIKIEDKIKTITTQFRLKNKETEMYLNWSSKVYPQWGFGQGEVTCVNHKNSGTIWNVEENNNDDSVNNQDYSEIRSVKSKFLKHVLELNVAMYNTNKALTQEENLEPVKIVSRPKEWFMLRRGLRMNSWDDSNTKFYMFGNPIIWYLSSICVLLSPFILLFKTIKYKREGQNIAGKECFEVFICFGGWAIHYLPFYIVGRVLYFHHYFPALFFAMLSVHYCFKVLPFRCLVALLFASVFSYFYFSDLTYGIDGASNLLKSKKWVKSWDFCDQ